MYNFVQLFFVVLHNMDTAHFRYLTTFIDKSYKKKSLLDPILACYEAYGLKIIRVLLIKLMYIIEQV